MSRARCVRTEEFYIDAVERPWRERSFASLRGPRRRGRGRDRGRRRQATAEPGTRTWNRSLLEPR